MINVLQKTSISLLRVYFQGVLYGTLTCHQRKVIPVLFWRWSPPPPLLKVKCLPTFLFNRKKKNLGQFSFFLLLQRQPLLWLNTLDLGCCLLGGQSQCTENIFSPFTRELVSWFSVFFSLAGRGLSLFGVYPYTQQLTR